MKTTKESLLERAVKALELYVSAVVNVRNQYEPAATIPKVEDIQEAMKEKARRHLNQSLSERGNGDLHTSGLTDESIKALIDEIVAAGYWVSKRRCNTSGLADYTVWLPGRQWSDTFGDVIAPESALTQIVKVAEAKKNC